ncbi:MAG: formyltransferase family protein [Polyangiaceae bacterium]
MRIAFFGLPIAALLLHHDGHTLVHAAICRPGANGTRRLRTRLGASRVSSKPVLTKSFVEGLRREAPDLVVSWFWTTLLPKEVLDLAPLGTVGVHPSLLPALRGPDPYFWAIDSGLTTTGVTAHVLAESYDTGDVFATRELAIDPGWNAWTLAKRMDRPSLSLLRDVVGRFAREGRPTPRVQDHALATEAPEPNDDDLEIRWSWTSDRIARRVRAAAPWPGAFTELGDVVVTLTEVAPTRAYPGVLEPGEAAVVTRDGRTRALVRTGDGALELVRGRVDDDDGERDLDADAFVALVKGATEGASDAD